VITLIAFVVLALLAWGCYVVAHRAWAQMPLDKTPTPWSRSQARNRAGAAVYHEGRPHIHRVHFARRRILSETKND